MRQMRSSIRRATVIVALASAASVNATAAGDLTLLNLGRRFFPKIGPVTSALPKE